MAKFDEYSQFVTHPRFGQRPRMTGLNPETDYGGDVFLHWHSPKECRIPNTAICADISRQSPATVPVTHCFDVMRQCHDCSKPFIFFAAEQKYWYEDLGFGLDSDCVRCAPCRKKQQGIARLREKYEELFHITDRTTEKNLEMAECCLGLIEASVFHKQKLQRVRMLLNRVPSEISQDTRARFNELHSHILALESKDAEI